MKLLVLIIALLFIGCNDTYSSKALKAKEQGNMTLYIKYLNEGCANGEDFSCSSLKLKYLLNDLSIKEEIMQAEMNSSITKEKTIEIKNRLMRTKKDYYEFLSKRCKAGDKKSCHEVDTFSWEY